MIDLKNFVSQMDEWLNSHIREQTRMLCGGMEPPEYMRTCGRIEGFSYALQQLHNQFDISNRQSK